MTRTTSAVPAPGGRCQTHWFRPDRGGGPWPAVVFCIDGVGARPSLFEMADRIAQRGYLVAMSRCWRRPSEPPPAPDLDATGLFARAWGAAAPSAR